MRRRVEELERREITWQAECEHQTERAEAAEKRVEQQAVLIETLEERIKGLHVANDSFGDLAKRVEELKQTSGDLCDSCGWRTVIAGTCVKCEGERVEEMFCRREE